MRTSNCLLPKVLWFAVLAIAFHVGVPPLTLALSDGVVPANYQSGSFFNQKLGHVLRFNYNTRGYGTQDDVFSLGGMKVWNMDGATVFVDGQGTLSDDFGGGFNLGVGYRQLTMTGMSFDPERILGASFWTDGQSSTNDNFFTQLGFSLESLGESYDSRISGYFPLERSQTSDPVLSGTGTPFFLGNNIFGATEVFNTDVALTVVDSEFSKRINDLEAWGFFGTYHLNGSGVSTTGYRAGVRGYAVPDLALSLQVTDDNLYSTNVMFGATWFIGRTNKCNGPCGTILDRFREPVRRNNFIAMTSRRTERGIGDPLTDSTSNDTIRVVHIDSTAGAGGDGTFENPYDEVSDIDAILNAANSQEGDILFVHSNSTFNGASGLATLQDNQRLLGEGTDPDGLPVPHTVATNELGIVNLPETDPDNGSSTLARAVINAGGADVFTLADNNSVNNFTINNSGTAISASPDDIATDPLDALQAPQLGNLLIDGTTNGILLTNTSGSAVVENTVTINNATGIGVEVNGGSNTVAVAATINDTTGQSLVVQNRTGGSVDYTGMIDDDTDESGDFSDGVAITNNSGSTINLTNTNNIRVDDGLDAIEISGNTETTVLVSGATDATAAGTGQAVNIFNNDADSTFTFNDLNATAENGNTVSVRGNGTATFSSADDTRMIANTGIGTAFFNDGAAVDNPPAGADPGDFQAGNATLTVNSNIDNSGGGRAVSIANRNGDNNILFSGTVTADDAGSGVLIQNNMDGTIAFADALTLDTGDNNAVEILTNPGATVTFLDLDIDTNNGDGFVATGGGSLIVASPNNANSIDVTGTGQALNLTGLTIETGDVTFDTVNVSSNGGGINLQNLAGDGTVNIGGGTDAGDGGTLTTTGTAINVNDANNVAVTNVTISNGGVNGGVNVTGQQAGSTATFTGLNVNTINADAVSVNGNTDGTITFSDLDSSSTGTGHGFAATGAGNITVNGTNTIDSTGNTAFDVNDVESLNASNVTIANSTTAGVNVTGLNDATDAVTLDNFDVTTTTANAVTVTGNTNGTVVLSNMTAESTDGDAVVVTNNTGATVSVNGVTATATGSGDAFTATGGGTLIGNSGTNNARANTGRGVTIEDMTINSGLTFADVDVTAGTDTGISLDNVTGARVTVNGGSINTANNSVILTGVTDSAFNNLTVETSNNVAAVLVNHDQATASSTSFNNLQITTVAGSGNGVVVNDNGAGELDFTLQDSSVNVVAADTVGFTLNTNANAGEIDVRLTGNTIIADSNSAVLANLDSGSGDVQFLVNDGNDWTNNNGANATASFLVTASRILNATIGDQIGNAPFDENRFANAAGTAFSMESNNVAATVNLDLRGNTASGLANDYLLTETAGTFGVVDRTETITNGTNNTGTVTLGGGGVEANFDDLAPPIKQVD